MLGQTPDGSGDLLGVGRELWSPSSPDPAVCLTSLYTKYLSGICCGLVCAPVRKGWVLLSVTTGI